MKRDNLKKIKGKYGSHIIMYSIMPRTVSQTPQGILAKYFLVFHIWFKSLLESLRLLFLSHSS